MVTIFPPNRTDGTTTDHISEIAERHNPDRRLRSYPRVVKRRTVGDKLVKRTHHREIIFTDPPEMKIQPRAA